jgi:hypothetical protein
MNKLRPDRSINVFLPAIFVLLAFFITLIYFGLNTAYNILGVGFWVVGVMQFVVYSKTLNTGYMISTLYLVCIGIFAFSLDFESLNRGERLSNTSALLGLLCIFFIGWLIYLLVTGQIKWKGRYVFELAARNIHSTDNGFTERPKPAGLADYTIDEILGYARFMAKNLVCFSYFDGGKLYLIPVSQGKEWGMALGPGHKMLNRSWISFDEEGHVTVHITRDDYLNYRDAFSFDQLCDALGQLFIDFLELYKHGDAKMIINRLEAMRR